MTCCTVQRTHPQWPKLLLTSLDFTDVIQQSAFEVKSDTECHFLWVSSVNRVDLSPSSPQSNPWNRLKSGLDSSAWCLSGIWILLHKQTAPRASTDCLHNPRLFSFNCTCTVYHTALHIWMKNTFRLKLKGCFSWPVFGWGGQTRTKNIILVKCNF